MALFCDVTLELVADTPKIGGGRQHLTHGRALRYANGSVRSLHHHQGHCPAAIKSTRALGLLGPKLLMLLLGVRAVALNLAAAADSGVGATLSEASRESVLPLVRQLLEVARRDAHLSFVQTDPAVGSYFNLLIGDLQIRRVMVRVTAPNLDFYNVRFERAIMRLRQILT